MYDYNAIVVAVYDGDTVTLDVDQGFNIWHHKMRIRLARINAPELRVRDATGVMVDNPVGFVARDFLAGLMPVGSPILLHSLKDRADNYGGRWDGELFVNGVNLNDLMLSSGNAFPYR